MAKDKKAKLKIPKQIAGVKIPKELRKKARVAVALAESPIARELIAAGLTAAAAALAKDNKRPQAASTTPATTAAGAKAKAEPRKRDAFATVAKDIALEVAAAYAAESRKQRDKRNGGAADELESAAH